MPYVEINSFKTPSNDTRIWRYMDFMKFVNLITIKKMFLCRADYLTDSHEGRMPIPFHKAIETSEINPTVKGLTPDGLQMLLKGAFAAIKQSVYINCWHMNNYESEGMWKGYVPNGDGIAIQSTIGSMKKAISQCFAPIHIGRIRYTDYQTIGEEGMNPFAAYTLKGMKYDYEKEVRLLLPSTNGMNLETCGVGIMVPIDISLLIEKIYLPSDSAEWKLDTVKRFLEAYKINKKVKLFEY